MFEVKKGDQEKKDDVNKVRMTQLVVWVCVGGKPTRQPSLSSTRIRRRVLRPLRHIDLLSYYVINSSYWALRETFFLMAFSLSYH